MLTVIEELLSFDCLNFNVFSSSAIISCYQQMEFMKLINTEYILPWCGYARAASSGVISYKGVIVL